MTRSQLTSTVEQNSAGAAAPFVAGKNKIINGDFGVWQRGTSFTGAQGSYTADRWTSSCNVSGASLTVTQDSSVPSAAFNYSAKYVQTSSVSSVVEYVARQFIEASNLYQFAGKTVTLSFWYKSNKTGTHAARINSQQTGGGDYVTSFTVNTANTWQFITITSATPFGSITANATAPTAFGGFIDIGFRSNGTTGFTSLSANDYFQLDGVQLEAGSVATPFTTATGTVQGELAACQRYYVRLLSEASTGYGMISFGNAVSTSYANTYCILPVAMRALPSAVDYSGSLAVGQIGINAFSVSSISITQNSRTTPLLNISATNTVVAGMPVAVSANNTSTGYIGFSAEL